MLKMIELMISFPWWSWRSKRRGNDEGNLPMVEHCLEPRKEQAEQLFLI